ncbi:hypothetical protein MKX03_000108 [Papaver bracteatum]|nr:hypothetical protein MKX03_000108 [Papaver bracteatum]
MQKGLIFTNSQSLPKQQQKEDVLNDGSISDKISHLKTSLSSTLDHFFPLAGRLAIEKHEDDNTISVYINCNFEGVEFIHATAEISEEDILSPIVPQSIIDSLIPFNGVLNYEGQSHPLLSVQVTELSDDAVFIGCSANHSVCDGASIWQFINSWSDISRSSSDHTSYPPLVFKRWFIKETDFPIRLPFSFAEKFSAVRNTKNTEVPPLECLVEKCFRFTKPSIAKLKARALELNSEAKRSREISSLQALLAHVWTAVIRARFCLTNSHDENRKILIALFMNNRTKLIPPLPEEYFGNSLIGGDILVKEGEVLDKGFGFLAASLSEVVNSHNYEKSRSFFESWVEKPFIPSSGDENGIMDIMLLARSSQWFNKYGNDFGWGRPSAVKTGRNGKYVYGITTVSRGPVEGSIDIEICLPVEVFKAMEDDAEFMEALSC